MSHNALKTPVVRKAYCQCVPSRETIIGMIVGARIAPTFDPALKMPVAKARSFFGNHSPTVLMAAGKLPDSPEPRPNLGDGKARKMNGGRTGAWKPAKMAQRPIGEV